MAGLGCSAAVVVGVHHNVCHQFRYSQRDCRVISISPLSRARTKFGLGRPIPAQPEGSLTRHAHIPNSHFASGLKLDR